MFILPGFVTTLPAQTIARLTTPQVSVSLTHPPGLGLELELVAVAAYYGPCSQALMDLVVRDFLENDIEVVDRLCQGSCRLS